MVRSARLRASRTMAVLVAILRGAAPRLLKDEDFAGGGEDFLRHSGLAQGPPRDGEGRLPLALRLALAAAGLVDLDRDGQGFHAAAVARAADRGGAEIVEADRDARVGVGGADRIGGIEPDPAQIRHEGFGPGVAGLLVD